MEQRKFLKLTKDSGNKPILIPVDNIITIEEGTDNIVRITFQYLDDIRHVFIKDSIEEITQGFVSIIL